MKRRGSNCVGLASPREYRRYPAMRQTNNFARLSPQRPHRQRTDTTPIAQASLCADTPIHRWMRRRANSVGRV
jgi:hypothetical protein